MMLPPNTTCRLRTLLAFVTAWVYVILRSTSRNATLLKGVVVQAVNSPTKPRASGQLRMCTKGIPLNSKASAGKRDRARTGHKTGRRKGYNNRVAPDRF